MVALDDCLVHFQVEKDQDDVSVSSTTDDPATPKWRHCISLPRAGQIGRQEISDGQTNDLGNYW